MNERRFYVLCEVKGYTVIDKNYKDIKKLATFINGVDAKTKCDDLNKRYNCKCK
jgi:hypothetical protein